MTQHIIRGCRVIGQLRRPQEWCITTLAHNFRRYFQIIG
jgi:hypothetical protein